MILRVRAVSYISSRPYVQALMANQGHTSAEMKAVSPRWRLKNRNEIEENVKRRGLLHQINVPDLYEHWEMYKSSERKKEAIEKRRAQLIQLIIELNNAETLSAEQKTSHQSNRNEARMLHREYEKVCQSHRDIRKQFLDHFLALPNKLLQHTPDELEIALIVGQKSNENPSKHHLSYDHLIDYYNEKMFYLKSDAATFDTTFPLKCLDYFRRHGFVQFYNPDFSKTFIVEGAAVSLEQFYEVEHSRNESLNSVHLVGGGSWLSFLGFMAKHKFEEQELPMQLVSTGRKYVPTNSNDSGLFDVAQSTMVQLFLAGTEQEMNDKFNTTLDLMIQLYRAIDIHFRVVNVPANQLELAECFATRIEMFSQYFQNYYEIGRISFYGDHISKRLLFECNRNREKFPRILGATVCNVTKLLAIILETHDGKIPKTIVANQFLK